MFFSLPAGAGEDHKFVVGHKAVACLDTADGLAAYGNTGDLHLDREGVLGKPLRRSGLVYPVAGYVSVTGVVIYFHGQIPPFFLTIPFFTGNLVIKIYKIC